MSTRANIKIIEGDKVTWLYHHWDGYPSYLGAFLLYRLGDKFKNENYCIDTCDIVNKLIKDKADNGFEYTDQMHGDIEYLYEIDVKAKTIKCFETHYVNGPNNEPFWDIEVGNEVNLRKEAPVWKVTRSDKGDRDTWYLSNYNGNIYQDGNDETVYFDSAQQAEDKAYELMLHEMDQFVNKKGEDEDDN